MKRFGWLNGLWLLLLLGLAACGGEGTEYPGNGGDSDTGAEADSEKGGEGDQPGEAFRFVVISDTHVRLTGKPDDGAYSPTLNQKNLRGAVERINKEFADAAFAAVTGDLVGCLFSENPDDYGTGVSNPAETFKEIMGGLSIPYHVALGNHDYQKNFDAGMKEGISTDNLAAIESVWKKVLDLPPYYSISYHGVRLLFLNSNRGDARSAVCIGEKVEAYCTGSFDAEQIAWLEQELAHGDPVILFFHHPPVTDSKEAIFSFAKTFLLKAGDPFYSLAESNKSHILAIFVGHGHIWEYDTLDGIIPVYETGSIGDGAGDPDNMHVVSVDPAKPSIDVKMGRVDATYWSGKP